MPQRISAEEAKKRGLTPTRITAEEAAARGLKPSAPSIPKEPTAPAKQSVGETALHSGLQGISLGTGDEVQGLIGGTVEGGAALLEGLGLKEPPESLADPDIVGERPSMSEAPPVSPGTSSNRKDMLERILAGYTQARDWEREAVHRGEFDNPKTALGAEMVGSLLAPGPKASGVKGLARVGEGVKTGAKLGAAYGLGKSEADSAGGVALDTLKGAGMGGATGGVIGGVSAAAQPVLKRLADRYAFKAADPYQKTLQPLMDKSPRGNKMQEPDRLGRMALDEGMVRPFDKSADIAKRAASELDDTGEMLGATLQRIQDETATKALKPTSIPGRPINTVTVGRQLIAKADELEQSPASVDLADALRREGEKILRSADATVEKGGYVAKTLPEAEDIKRGLQKAVKPKDWHSATTAPGAEAKMEASRGFKRAVEDAVEGLAGPGDLDQFKALKGRFGRLADIEDLASYGSARQARNNLFSLGDRQLMQLGAEDSQSLSDASAKALAMGLVGKLTRERGSSTAATIADALQKGGTARLPIGGATGMAADLEAQSLTSDEEQRRRLLGLLAKGR